MIKVYIAGKWSHKKLMKYFIDSCSKHFLITHDWTITEQEGKNTPDDMHNFALMDVDGVKNANVLIIIVSDSTYPYRGTCTEMGIALGLNTKILVLDLCNDSAFRKNIFTHHKNVKYMKHPVDMASLENLEDDETKEKATKLINLVVDEVLTLMH